MVRSSGSPSYVLRHVNDADVDDLLRWRNASNVRASMINQKLINPEEHRKWWRRVRKDKSRYFLILERETEPLAVINFFNVDNTRKIAWWGFYLTDAVQNQDTFPIWVDLEGLALRFAFESLSVEQLFCETRMTNEPVLMLHRRFGFENCSTGTLSEIQKNDLIVLQMTASHFSDKRHNLLSDKIVGITLPFVRPIQSASNKVNPKLVIVGSANWDQVVSDLESTILACSGLTVDCSTPSFGQGFMELMSSDSELFKNDPEYLILAERFEDFILPLETVSDTVLEGLSERFADYIMQIRSIRSKMTGHIFIHDLCSVRPFLSSFYDAIAHRGLIEKAIIQMNETLAKLCQELPDCTILPIGRLVSDIGVQSADPKKYWLLARFPFGPKFTPRYHRLLAGAIMALNGSSARGLVLDLDNTLWGGVIGDDGTFGVQLGPDYPGNQFVAFQHFIKSLSEQGLVLTVCSKNTEEVALDAFRNNPNMLISENDLITHRINWAPKSENILEISQELELGLGSLMFVDDNPIEREEVRQNCPNVIVPEMPLDVTEWPGFLARHPALSKFQLIDQDRERAEKYKIRAQVKWVQSTSKNRHAFLHNLGMGIEVANINEITRNRALQLIIKTNQFNTTTKRYSELEIDDIVTKGNDLLTVRITDRFGSDETIAVLAIIYKKESIAWIDNFVMSCRVMGRGVETAILADICQRALVRGCVRLVGPIKETERNLPCREVYAQHNFEEVERGIYSLDLTKPVIFPDWFQKVSH